jgi:glucosamine kinase
MGSSPVHTELLLGVDGGGTRCRARLAEPSGLVLGEGSAGPANIRFGVEESFAAVLEACMQCFHHAGLAYADLERTIACLALAGATEPTDLARARARMLPFCKTWITTDAHAACVGAHGGRDGGIVIVGTGSVGWGIVRGGHHRVGGWGFPISDEGSGAWLGCEAVRRVLWAHDGRIAWSSLLRALFAEFQSDPHAIVRWVTHARPADFGRFAPLIIEHASRDDPVGRELVSLAAHHIDALAARLVASGADRLCVVGGLAPHIEPWLASETRRHLVAPEGDALTGALQLAQAEASSVPELIGAGELSPGWAEAFADLETEGALSHADEADK